jgi:hypothetical protein
MVVKIYITDLSNIKQIKKENINGPESKFWNTLMERYNHSTH